MKFSNDQEMFSAMRKNLYTAVCCDAMDELGFRNQAMRENIRPIRDDMVVIGRAKTVLAVDVFQISENHYENEIKAIDSVLPGDVVVVATNNSTNNGIWGELLSTATKMRGGNGAIIDGLGRDVNKIKQLDFPVFAVGNKPVDSSGRGRVIDYDCAIECGGIRVNPGDLIFADIDGAIAIPKEIADMVIARALDKVMMENMTRQELLSGKLLADVYAKYGVL